MRLTNVSRRHPGNNLVSGGNKSDFLNYYFHILRILDFEAILTCLCTCIRYERPFVKHYFVSYILRINNDNIDSGLTSFTV